MESDHCPKPSLLCALHCALIVVCDFVRDNQHVAEMLILFIISLRYYGNISSLFSVSVIFAFPGNLVNSNVTEKKRINPLISVSFIRLRNTYAFYSTSKHKIVTIKGLGRSHNLKHPLSHLLPSGKGGGLQTTVAISVPFTLLHTGFSNRNKTKSIEFLLYNTVST